MRGRTKRAGEGEVFDDYYDDPDVARIGTYNDTDYMILRQHASKTGQPSHYTAYVCIPGVCTHRIDSHDLPYPPAHEEVTFGPTTDGWFGFGTLDSRDYNYDTKMQPLPADTRMETLYDDVDRVLHEKESISHWTPDTLEDATLEWIADINDYLDTAAACRACDTT